MADEVKNIEKDKDKIDIGIQNVSDLKVDTFLSGSIGNLISETNSGINDIVRIRNQEKLETGLFSGVYNSVRDRFYQALGVTLDPSIFAEMTDTLNKHREILEMGIPDNYEINQKISV